MTMNNSNLVNRNPFLEQQKNFSGEVNELAKQVFDTYVDIARYTNDRVIGNHALVRPSATGEKWFISSVPYSGFRKVFTASTQDHGILPNSYIAITKIYGAFTDGTNWYPLPYVHESDINEQISLTVTPTQLVVTPGSAAPTITSGYVVIEWIAQNKL